MTEVPVPRYYRLLPLVPLVVVAVVWQLFALGKHQGWALPTFTGTVVALAQLLVSTALWSALGSSALALVIGFVAAAVVGLPLGLLLGAFPPVERFVDVYLTALLVMPMAALVPLVVVVFGLGTVASAVVVFLFALVYIIVNTMVGARLTPRSLREMAASFGAAPLQVYRRVVLPHAVPEIVAGLRNGLGHGVNGMIVAEFELVTIGIGRLVDEYSSNFQAAQLFAVIIILLGFGAALLSLLERGEHRLTAWKRG